MRCNLLDEQKILLSLFGNRALYLIIIEYEFYCSNCTEPVVYIKAMNLNGCRLKAPEGASRSSIV